MQFEKENKKLKTAVSMAVLCFLSALMALCGTLRLPMRIENYSEDYLYRKLDGIAEDIRIIAIDDDTLDMLGPYSDWNRGYFARLIEILYADENSKPGILGIDVIFSGTNDSEEDAALVRAAAKAGNVVLASSLESDDELLGDDGTYHTRTYISDEYKPYDALAAVTEHGFTNVITDRDGIVRKAYTTIPPDHRSFATVIASKLGTLPEYDTREELRFSMKPGAPSCIRFLIRALPRRVMSSAEFQSPRDRYTNTYPRIALIRPLLSMSPMTSSVSHCSEAAFSALHAIHTVSACWPTTTP